VISRRAGDQGFKPFCAIYSTFYSGRSIPSCTTYACRICVCLHGPRRLVGDDGRHTTALRHHYLRGIPNIVHMVPKDEDELADMLFTAMLHDGPSRYGIRAGWTGHPGEGRSRAFHRASGTPATERRPVAIFALGRWSQWLRNGGETGRRRDFEAVINARFTKPVDVAMLEFMRAAWR